MEGERVSRHLGDKHDIPPTVRKELSAFMKYLSLPDPNQVAPTLLCRLVLKCVAFRPNLPDKRRWQPRNMSRVHPKSGNVSRFYWLGTRHVTVKSPRNSKGIAWNASHLLAVRHSESEAKPT
jgi:hypothetical protein